MTARSLDRINTPYRIVIEPQEYDAYSREIAKENILTLPFSNLGQGGIPARNWVWEHSTKEGHAFHWIMDDNIRDFYRLHNNTKNYVGDGTVFRCMEDFVQRYENIPMAGPNYHGLVDARSKGVKPFKLNTRVYSCILLSNKVSQRWRGRYNEDTDLSLRFLKEGYCTVLFNAFLAEKKATMKMGGGNTEELYQQTKEFDGRLEMAKSLREQHPDVTKIVWKWNRWQHQVDYSRFKKNLPKKKKDTQIQEGVNNYGMRLLRD